MSKGPAEFGKVVGYGTEDIAILECREKFFCGLVFLTTKVKSTAKRSLYWTDKWVTQLSRADLAVLPPTFRK